MSSFKNYNILVCFFYHKSTLASYLRSKTISGAIYNGDPRRALFVSSELKYWANPKSANFKTGPKIFLK